MKYLCISLLLMGCGSGDGFNKVLQEIDSMPDPSERGLMYIALAIIISAIIKAIFNK